LKEEKFLVWSRGIGPSGGLGNDFIFWPAVFVTSLLSGRRLVIDDVSKPHFKIATICNASYLNCQVPLLSTLSLTKSELFSIVRTDVSSILSPEHENRRILRVDGFYRSSDWWQQNTTLARCVKQTLKCPGRSRGTKHQNIQKQGRNLCVERAAMSLLVGTGPGEGLRRHADALTNRLVGSVDKRLVKEYLHNQYGHEHKIFAASIHLRFQFSGVEQDGVTSQISLIEITKWLSTEKNRQIFEFLSETLHTKIKSYLNNNPNYIFNRDNSNNMNIQLYLTSDSEALKVLMYQYLSTNYSVSYLPTDSRNPHIRTFETSTMKDPDAIWPDILFDWLMLANSEMIFSYRSGFFI
jgi:hypothetical protein